MKKVGKYLAISMLLLLGLCCVGVLYIFFIPNASLFNITYINHNNQIKSSVYNAEEISHVVVNSRAYDVEVVASNNDEIQLEVYSNSFGFTLTKNENVNLSASVSNSVLTFNVKESYGAAIKNNSRIKLHVSSNFPVDLTLSNKSATTIINSDDVKIKNLTYSSNNGNFYFNKGQINETINLDINKANFYISNTVKTNINNVKLKLSSGKFYANNQKLGEVELLKNSRGVVNIKECTRFTENISSAGGQINIEKASYVNILTSDSIISINEITDGANIELTASGKVSIQTLKTISSIKTNSGDIFVNNAESNLTLHSNSGNIKVNSAQTIVSVNTISGKAEIFFNENAESFKNSTDGFTYRVLNARVKNGTLIATGVEHLGLVKDAEGVDVGEGVEITGSGKITIKMNNVFGENQIIGNNGNVNMVINKQSVYTLLTESETGNVRVNLTQIIQYGGYNTTTLTETNVNCKNSENKLSVKTTNGSLFVYDTNFAN